MRIIKYIARAPWSSSDKLARHEPRLRLRLRPQLRLRQSRTRWHGRGRSGKMASFRLCSLPRPPDSWKQIVSVVTKYYSLWPPKKYKLVEPEILWAEIQPQRDKLGHLYFQKLQTFKKSLFAKRWFVCIINEILDNSQLLSCTFGEMCTRLSFPYLICF